MMGDEFSSKMEERIQLVERRISELQELLLHRASVRPLSHLVAGLASVIIILMLAFGYTRYRAEVMRIEADQAIAHERHQAELKKIDKCPCLLGVTAAGMPVAGFPAPNPANRSEAGLDILLMALDIGGRGTGATTKDGEASGVEGKGGPTALPGKARSIGSSNSRSIVEGAIGLLDKLVSLGLVTTEVAGTVKTELSAFAKEALSAGREITVHGAKL